ncbi:uncharacterized protein BP5553_07713 [Venustampulla echinocandica]|uniref:Ubiquitin 3 binding protein But2 C-terminal domain-containing protein n=1 Tax=Venustampulla echinocandica TaxID=2656787 RepID=A0A370THA8_9HELO|nr:uncharacterized protein BP5553_07713 [Venustampulla echinocandica]RDL34585.1 hypothetical protein BP5553_07713 [Venustampulla echinocandica]
MGLPCFLLALAFCAVSIVDSKPFNRYRRDDSAPNPIGSQYPNNVTGTLNQTISIVPIPFALARSIIPAQYGILTAAYKSLLPGFPANSYPSFHISYPFVDLLGDGYSSFQYQEYLFVTSTNPYAISGTEAYGTIPVPATFNPPDKAYAFTCPDPRKNKGDIFFDAYVPGNSQPVVTTKFKPMPAPAGPYSLNFFVNVTNQPAFTDALACDNQIFYYNTTLSQGANAPVTIKGDIKVTAPYLPTTSTFKNVWGIKVDLAFLENNLLPCGDLKGYQHV